MDSSIDISLGAMGDLLWRLVPEAREEITNLVKEELEDHIDSDSGILMLQQLILCRSLWRLLRPALDSCDIQMIKRAMEVMNGILDLGNVPYGIFADALYHAIIDYIESEKDRELLRSASPQVYQRIKEAYGLRLW